MSQRGSARGLLLDIGGVVLRGGAALVRDLGAEDERLRAEIERLDVAGPGDELWQRMLAGEVGERDYWARRAAVLGAVVGERWDTRALITRLYDRPPDEWLNHGVVELMTDAKKAGLGVVALTNDLSSFHGDRWVAGQDWLDPFDAVIDASKTGIMKPAPEAYAAGIAALGLPAGEIVFLDDMPWNVAGGERAGLQAIRVPHTDPERAVAEARRRLDLPD